MRYLVTRNAYKNEFDDDSAFTHTFLVEADNPSQARDMVHQEYSSYGYDVGYNVSYEVTLMMALLTCELNRVKELNNLWLPETKDFY